MDTELFHVDTSNRTVVDVTGVVAGFCGGRGDGLCHVLAPHATCGLALMETGSGSEQDLEALLGRLVPKDATYRHRHGSPGHGADHLLPVLVAPFAVLPVSDGRLLLGTWQSLVVVDLNPDNPRRQLRCSWVGAPS